MSGLAVHVCPGCGVRAATLDAEHLNDCPYQGRNALPRVPRSLDWWRGSRVHSEWPCFEGHKRVGCCDSVRVCGCSCHAGGAA